MRPTPRSAIIAPLFVWRDMVSDTRIIPVPSQRPRFVCTHCWFVFEDDRALTCPSPEGICRNPRPEGGWSALPYRVRGNFVLQSLLGRGGMGAVFLAWNTEHERPVALKVAQRLGSEKSQQQIREMFEHEARQSTFLATYPKHYVSVLSFGVEAARDAQSDGIAFLEMEYVQLPTLHMLLRETPMPPLRVARIGAALAQSLIPMHQHRLVHRDLKPGNVFVHEGGIQTETRVFDFGVCVPEGADPNRTSFAHLYPQREVIPGTDVYMSPEQMDRQPLYVESDIHAVGSILWRLCTKNVPFRAVGPDQQTKLDDRRKRVQTVPSRPDSMPQGLYDILKQALDPNPDKRFPQPPGNARDYTPAMGLMRALQGFADDLVRERRAQTEKSRQQVRSLVSKAQLIENKVERAAQLAAHVQGMLDELRALAEYLEEDDGEKSNSTTDALATLAAKVRALEDEASRLIGGIDPPPVPPVPQRWRGWLPWTIAGLSALVAVAAAMKPSGPTGSGGVEVAGPKPPPPNPPEDITQFPPVPDGGPTIGDAPTPVGNPEPDPGQQPDAETAAPPVTPTPTPTPPPACSKVTVELAFDMVARVETGQRIWEEAKTIELEVSPGGPDITVSYQDVDSVGDPGAPCQPQQKTFTTAELIDEKACTARPPKDPIAVCPKTR